MRGPERRGGVRGIALRLGVALAAALVTAFVAAEVALRLRPALLPAWYRARFPMHGVELFHPGVLDGTPITGVPLPLVLDPHEGPPPADLKEIGLVPADEGSDARDLPDLFLPADARGLPNREALERADVVLVGDSFTVSMGVLRPPGLQALLAEATGLTVYNAGVAALGPVREAWMLEHVALPLRPRCVLWFWFAGNDVLDVVAPLSMLRLGKKTWGEAHAEHRPPALRSLDLLGVWLARSDGAAGREPLPGLRFPLEGGGSREVWFHPRALRQLAWSADDWRANPALEAAFDAVRGARRLSEDAGARFLVVYLPSKAEVLLPHVEADAEAVRRMASFDLPDPLEEPAAELLRRMLERRSVQETLFLDFCRAEGIPVLSARPVLEAFAASGRMAYLAADTHWQPVGQAALLDPLFAWLEEEGILGP